MREQEIAREEAARFREAYHEKKMRQQVRENNQELRELESKLRTAYVSKALAVQKKEREALMLVEKIQEKEECEMLEKARLAHLEQIKKDQEVDRARKRKLHEDLTEQIISAHQQHQKLYEEFLREKYYLDEIAQRIKEELIEQTQRKIERKEQTKKEMDAFKAIKKELERQLQIDTDEENQRIIEYCQLRDKKIEEEERRAQELEKNRKNLNEKMVAELSELIVSLHILYFVSKRDQKCINMLAIWKTLAQALEHHRLLKNGGLVVFERDDSVLVQIDFPNDDVRQILDGFVDVFVLMLVDKLAQQVHHVFASNLILAGHVVDFETIFDFLLQRAA